MSLTYNVAQRCSSSPRFSNTIRPIQAPRKSGKKHPGRRLNILSKLLPFKQLQTKYPFKTLPVLQNILSNSCRQNVHSELWLTLHAASKLQLGLSSKPKIMPNLAEYDCRGENIIKKYHQESKRSSESSAFALFIPLLGYVYSSSAISLPLSLSEHTF